MSENNGENEEKPVTGGIDLLHNDDEPLKKRRKSKTKSM